jgi:hypothetical protein
MAGQPGGDRSRASLDLKIKTILFWIRLNEVVPSDRMPHSSPSR